MCTTHGFNHVSEYLDLQSCNQSLSPYRNDTKNNRIQSNGYKVMITFRKVIVGSESKKVIGSPTPMCHLSSVQSDPPHFADYCRPARQTIMVTCEYDFAKRSVCRRIDTTSF